MQVEFNYYIRAVSLVFNKITIPLQQKTKIILGIDPGSIIMGYGIIKCTGNVIELVDMDVLKPGLQKDIYKRLHLIHNTVAGIIKKYKPTDFAIEAPFFGKNVQSMLKLGRAQGVAIAAAMQAGLDVTEYSPKKIKQSVTGNGNANKDQVWQMLKTILKIKEEPKYFDASDALGVALCHYINTKKINFEIAGITKKAPHTKAKKQSWESFIQQNPSKLKK
jgi:crossover junction endodeoxyribonuclease RuvC